MNKEAKRVKRKQKTSEFVIIINIVIILQNVKRKRFVFSRKKLANISNTLFLYKRNIPKHIKAGIH